MGADYGYSSIAFAHVHPTVSLAYLVGILGITMCCRHPVLLGVSLGAALMMNLWLRGRGFLRGLLLMAGVMLAFTVGFLPLFSHHGVTPLYYVNSMPVTLESMIYGVVMTEMLLAVVLWSMVLSVFLDSERLLYLTGRLTPAVGLLLSMILGMVPRLRRQYQEIRDAGRGLGREPVGLRPLGRLRYLLREFSVLISHGLENSVETAISMESRGYGVGRRSFFHLYRFHISDLLWIIFLVIGYGVVIAELLAGHWRGDFFPQIAFAQAQNRPGVFVLAVAALSPLLLQGIRKIEEGV